MCLLHVQNGRCAGAFFLGVPLCGDSAPARPSGSLRRTDFCSDVQSVWKPRANPETLPGTNIHEYKMKVFFRTSQLVLHSPKTFQSTFQTGRTAIGVSVSRDVGTRSTRVPTVRVHTDPGKNTLPGIGWHRTVP